MTPRSEGESRIARVRRILEQFDAGRPVLMPSELAARTHIPIATTYRLVNEMVAEGFLDRTADGLRTGIRLWELASRGASAIQLRHVALPFMEQLQATFHQHTQLAVLEGTDVLYLERLSAAGATINVTRTAGRIPAAISSPGLVLAAFADEQTRAAVLASPITRYTPLTPDAAAVAAMLPDVRRTGLANADGWIDVRSSGVSAPIRGADGAVVAALHMIVPNDGHFAGIAAPSVQMAALAISRALGWKPQT